MTDTVPKLTYPTHPEYTKEGYAAWQKAVEDAYQKAIYDVTPNLARIREDVHTMNGARAVISDGMHLLRLGLADKFVAKIAKLTEKSRELRDKTDKAAMQASLMGLRDMANNLRINISDPALKAALERNYQEGHIASVADGNSGKVHIDIKKFVEQADGEHALYGSKAFAAYVRKKHKNRKKALLAHDESFFGYDDIIGIVLNSFENVYQPTLHDSEKFLDETIDMALARQKPAFSAEDYEIIRAYTEQFRAHVKHDLMHVKKPPEKTMAEPTLKPDPKNPAWKKAVDAAYEKAMLEILPNLSRYPEPHDVPYVKGYLSQGKVALQKGKVTNWFDEKERTFLEVLADQIDLSRKYPSEQSHRIAILGLRSMADQLHITIDNEDVRKAINAIHQKDALKLEFNTHRYDIQHDMKELGRRYSQEPMPFGVPEFHAELKLKYPRPERVIYPSGSPENRASDTVHIYGMGIMRRTMQRLKNLFDPRVHNAVEFFDESVSMALEQTLQEMNASEKASKWFTPKMWSEVKIQTEKLRAYVKRDILGVRTPEEIQQAMAQATREVMAEVTSGRPGAPVVDANSLSMLVARLRMRALNFKERYDVGRYFAEEEDGNVNKNGNRIRAEGELRVVLNRILKRTAEILHVEIKGLTPPIARSYRPLNRSEVSDQTFQTASSEPTPKPPEKAMAEPQHDSSESNRDAAVEKAYQQARLLIMGRLDTLHDVRNARRILKELTTARDHLLEDDIGAFVTQLDNALNRPAFPNAVIAVLGMYSMATWLDIPTGKLKDTLERLQEKNKMEPRSEVTRYDIPYDLPALREQFLAGHIQFDAAHFKTAHPNATDLQVVYRYFQGLVDARILSLYDPKLHNPVKFFDQSVSFALETTLAESDSRLSPDQKDIITRSANQFRHYVLEERMHATRPEQVSAAMRKAILDIVPSNNPNGRGLLGLPPRTVNEVMTELQLRADNIGIGRKPEGFFTDFQYATGQPNEAPGYLRGTGPRNILTKLILNRFAFHMGGMELNGLRTSTELPPLTGSIPYPENNLPPEMRGLLENFQQASPGELLPSPPRMPVEILPEAGRTRGESDAVESARSRPPRAGR